MYLITGGGGALGEALARRLADDGCAVRVFDTRLPRRMPAAVECVEGDVRDMGRLVAATRGARAVFHLAQVTSHDRLPPEIVRGCNVGGTANVLWAAREAGVPRVVLRSTADVYGNVAGPVHETQQVPDRLDQFAAAKLEAEAACRRVNHEGGPAAVILRLSWVVGSRDTDTWLRPLLWALRHSRPIVAVGEGRNRVHLTAMSDCVEAFWRAATVADVGGETFNIAGAEVRAFAELIEELRSRLGSRSALWRVPQESAARALRGLARLRVIPLLPEQVDLLYADRVLDTSKAHARLGWTPQRSAVDAVLESMRQGRARA